MTIKHPDTFAAMSPAGFDGTFDWDFLKPAFAPTKIEPMDLDAIVERYGRFLVFETKTACLPIPQGQIITLESLVNTGLFTVVVLRTKGPGQIAGWDVWHKPKTRVKKEYREGDAQGLVEFVKRWFAWASQNPGRWRQCPGVAP